MVASANKPVIFLAFANDREDFLYNLKLEQRGIRSALAKAEDAGLCQVVYESNTSIDDIIDTFQRYSDRIAIFHYGGHAQDYSLLLESASGDKAPANSDGLVSFLGKQDGLQLVFINGCSSGKQAQELSDAGVPMVVGTLQPIDDALATTLSTRFYRGLAAGHSISRAWSEAVDQVRTQKGEDVYRGFSTSKKQIQVDTFPWQLYVREGAERLNEWTLPDAAQDPLFGLPEITQKFDLPDSPFLFLKRYEREHAEIFFGRSQEIRNLINKIRDPHAAPIISLSGQSGVGKSSLLEAGVLPRIENELMVEYIRRIDSLGLSGTLQTALAAAIKSAGVKTSKRDQGDILSLADWLAVEKKAGKPLVIILDQVEEYYTRPNKAQPAELDDLMVNLRAVFGDPEQRPAGKLIMIYREEHHLRIEDGFKRFLLARGNVYLKRLEQPNILAIFRALSQSPALQQKYNLHIDPNLPVMIADDLLADKESPVAPTLQILLTKLWSQAVAKNRSVPHFSVQAYQELQSQGVAIAEFFAQQMLQLRSHQREAVDSGLALELLYAHTTELGTAAAKRDVDLSEAYAHRAEALPGLLDACRKLFLLTDARQSEHSTILMHDVLAPVVRKEYHDSDTLGQRATRVLAAKMQELGHEQEGVFLDESDLKVVEAGKAGMRNLSDQERDLLAKSVQRNKARHKVRNVLWGVAGVLFLFAVGLSISTTLLKFQADRESLKARSQGLMNSAIGLQQADKTRAIRIMQEAYELVENDPSLQIRRSLYAIFNSREEGGFYRARLEHDLFVRKAIFSADGQRVLTTSGKYATLWSTNGTKLREYSHADYDAGAPPELLGLVTSASFSPDGKYVATAAADGKVRIWQSNSDSLLAEFHQPTVGPYNGYVNTLFTADGKAFFTYSASQVRYTQLRAEPGKLHLKHNDIMPRRPTGLQGLSAVSISPIEKSVFIATPDSGGQLWKEATGLQTILPPATSEGSVITKARYSPKAKSIFALSRDKSAVLVNLDGDTLLSSVAEDITILDVRFAPDGESLSIIRSDNSIHFISLSGAVPPATAKLGIGMESVAYSPDGSLVVVFGWGGQAEVLSPIGDKLLSIQHNKGVNSAAFTPDSEILLTASMDQTARTWALADNLNDGVRASTPIYNAQLSRDGKHILTSEADARLWTLKGDSVAMFQHKDYSVTDLLFTKDDREILTAYYDGTAKRWTGNGCELTTYPHGSSIDNLVLSPDGKLLLTVGIDNVARLWRLEGDSLASFPHISDGEMRLPKFAPDGEAVLTIARVELGDQEQVADKAPEFSPAKRALPAAQTRERKYAAIIWQLDGTQKQVLQHNAIILTADFSREGRHILTATEDSVCLWSVNGTLLNTYLFEERVKSSGFLPDGQRFLTVLNSDSLQIRTLENTMVARIYSGRTEDLDLDHRTGAFLSATGNAARLWTAGGDSIARFQHGSDVRTVMFSADGRYILSASDDQTARVWPLEKTIMEWLETAPIYRLSRVDSMRYGIRE